MARLPESRGKPGFQRRESMQKKYRIFRLFLSVILFFVTVTGIVSQVNVFASAGESFDGPAEVTDRYTYIYLSANVSDEVNHDIYTKSISHDAEIKGGSETPEAIAIRRELLASAEAWLESLVEEGMAVSDKASSGSLKPSYSRDIKIDGVLHHEIHESYHIIFSASLIPDEITYLKNLEFSIEVPEVGGQASDSAHPVVSVNTGGPYVLDEARWVTGSGEDAEDFTGTFASDSDYYARVTISSKDGAKISGNPAVTINGEPPEKLYINSDTSVTVIGRIHTSDIPVDDPMDNPFSDVHENNFFYDAVAWAVKNEITRGTSATTFSPDNTCTRAQIVTFLWRLAGAPEPETAENPFSDVNEKAYYYKPVLWAVENGITKGTDADKFSPNAGCTRGQVVTFLHRYKGEPEPNYHLNPYEDMSANPFVDVSEQNFFFKAVAWARTSLITNGVDESHFAPNAVCTRGQIVTFLFRMEQ